MLLLFIIQQLIIIYYLTHARSLRLSCYTLQPQKKHSVITPISIQIIPVVYA